MARGAEGESKHFAEVASDNQSTPDNGTSPTRNSAAVIINLVGGRMMLVVCPSHLHKLPLSESEFPLPDNVNRTPSKALSDVSLRLIRFIRGLLRPLDTGGEGQV